MIVITSPIAKCTAQMYHDGIVSGIARSNDDHHPRDNDLANDLGGRPVHSKIGTKCCNKKFTALRSV